MLLRRMCGLSATVSSRLRRGLSTAAASRSRPDWAMVCHAPLVQSPARRPSFQLLEPPSSSRLLVPLHLVDPRADPDADIDRFYGGFVEATSGDGLLLLLFSDLRGMDLRAAAEANARAIRLGEEFGPDDPDNLRFVCNPVTGEMFRLPDAGGTKKDPTVNCHGILTRSDREHGPPDMYAVAHVRAFVSPCKDAMVFIVRRFLSETGKWETSVWSGLPRRFRLDRPVSLDHEMLAFDGRLWSICVSWGALSFDPFSDRPDFRFHDLPRGSVMPERVEVHQELVRYRRVGVSQGKLRYAEVSMEEPFVLSSFVLDNDSGSWKLEYRMPLSRLLFMRPCLQQDAPQIAAVDPLNASVMHIKVGNFAFAVDMDKENVLACSVDDGDDDDDGHWCLKPCVLPPWLESSRIPSAGTLSSIKANVKSNTLSDVLVRVDSSKKN